MYVCRYHNGNDQDAGQLRGFGHTGFLVDDLDAACAYLEAQGVSFKKKPLEGTMRGELVYMCMYVQYVCMSVCMSVYVCIFMCVLYVLRIYSNLITTMHSSNLFFILLGCFYYYVTY
jgi:catechol 2,3-dioxygenase-like lactoylglutathione lyase family enzyme